VPDLLLFCQFLNQGNYCLFQIAFEGCRNLPE